MKCKINIKIKNSWSKRLDTKGLYIEPTNQ